MGSIILGFLGLFLAGGAWSFHKQGMRRIAVVIMLILAVSALIAAWAVTYR